MDNKNVPFSIQLGDGKSYTLDEFLAQIEPQYREDKTAIHNCITGLTDYAAQLAAQGQEEQLPQLRRLCVDLAEFWGLTDDDTTRGYLEMAKQYRDEFDSTVSAVKASNCIPELSKRAKADILDGLKLYAREMTYCGDMEQWIAECDTLAAKLQAEWEMDCTVIDKPDCALIGEDGNIFNLSAIAANTLRENRLQEQADELLKRIFDGECDGYDGALRVISEYVNIIGPDEGGMQMGGM